MTTERHNLARVICRDLLRHGFIPAILFIAVIVSAIFVVITAHKTRLLTAEREHLVLERNSLDIEWRNLILEENALGITAVLSACPLSVSVCSMWIRQTKKLS